MVSTKSHTLDEVPVHLVDTGTNTYRTDKNNRYMYLWDQDKLQYTLLCNGASVDNTGKCETVHISSRFKSMIFTAAGPGAKGVYIKWRDFVPTLIILSKDSQVRRFETRLTSSKNSRMTHAGFR